MEKLSNFGGFGKDTKLCHQRMDMLNKLLLTWGGTQRIVDSTTNRLKYFCLERSLMNWWENDLGQEISTELTINLTLTSGKQQC